MRSDEAGRIGTAGTPRAALAIDLGTGGPKAAVVSSSGEVLGGAFEPVGLSLIEGGGAEQDPNEWWQAICKAVRAALEASSVLPEALVGVGVTAQWSGTVAVDEQANPLRPAIIWMDSRGAEPMRRQVRGRVNVLGYGLGSVLRFVRVTGGAPGLSGKDPVAHILWVKENEPETYGATRCFLEPVDWLVARLSGRLVASYDSIALYWVTDNRDLGRVRYDERLLRISGLDRSKLPELVPTGSVVGGLTRNAAEDLGLKAGTPVAAGSGDLHSAAVGSGAVADFDAHLYIGTSSWISCHVPFKKTDVIRNVASIPAGIPGRYLVADEHETGGACLDYLRERVLVGPEERPYSYREIEDLASKAQPGSGGAIFAPWLNGERTPVDDHTIRGGFHNLSLSTTTAELARSVYEGVAYNSRWLLSAVEHFVGRRMEELAFIGGGAMSDLWCQVHADVTRRRIRRVEQPRLANVRGAGMLALLAVGEVAKEDLAKMVATEAVFEPDESASRTYDELYAAMIQIYKKNKAIHRRLNS
jgi:xylulokinase